MGSGRPEERKLSDQSVKTGGGSSEPIADDCAVSEEDRLRAGFYALLSCLLAKPMDDETIDWVRGLEGDDTELGKAINSLSALARRTTQAAVEDEFTVLFYGFGAGGELAPYGSQYLTGFVYEKPLADLRADLAELGVERAEGVTDPEDTVAFLCEVMHGLITGVWGAPVSLQQQKQFFERHLAPWAARFFADMEKAKSAVLYMPVGTIGRLFLEIERDAFGFSD